MNLDSIIIHRAGNGFIVEQHKSNKSKKREWMTFTNVHLNWGSASVEIDDLLKAWKEPVEDLS
jgi:hypothetical protein